MIVEINTEAPEVKKLSARKVIASKSLEIIEKTENIMTLLDETEAFARKNNRPHLHYLVFKRELEKFVSLFERLSR